MCGIGGITILAGSRTPQEISAIRQIAARLLLELEKRGADSAGIAVVNSDYVWTLKHPEAASRFIQSRSFSGVLGRVSPHTRGILLHARAATQGSETNNDNNHPIIAGDIVGVHNGIILNDDEIFRNFRRHFTRQAEVDSEAVFRLLNHYLRKDSFRDIQSIRKALKKISGSLAIAFIDIFNPGSFYLYTNRSYTPLSLAYLPGLDVFVFASQKEHIQRSISHSMHRKKCRYYSLRENELLKIRTSGKRLERYRAKTKKPVYRDCGWGMSYLNAWDKEGQLNLSGTFC